MDGSQFDTLTRVLSSRRIALAGLISGIAALLGLTPNEAAAHNPLPRCRKIKHPAARRRCVRNARRHNRQAHACKPEPIAVTCFDGVCGNKLNNCRQLVTCPCPTGRTCLSNQSCAQKCTPGGCVGGCACGVEAGGDGSAYCNVLLDSCDQAPQLCGSTVLCPRGSYCAPLNCPGGVQNRCVPLC